ncbi:MAG: hypothetical protein EBT60_06125 [Bacteroidetes bacterium]|nr:hypothetical protein [Bacteroidota bacterium]
MGQQHRDDGCDEEVHRTAGDSLAVGSKPARFCRSGAWTDSLLNINQISEGDLLTHPLLNEEEATANNALALFWTLQSWCNADFRWSVLWQSNHF